MTNRLLRSRLLCASISGLAGFPAAALAVSPQTTIQPSLGITYLVDDVTDFNNAGDIEMFAGNFAPSGTYAANGALIPISSDTTLFNRYGTTFGGDGQNNFALPNLSGAIPIGTGQGVGLTNRPLGGAVGVNSVTLTNANAPSSLGGGGQSFTNMQPSLGLNFYISTIGAYPSSNGQEVDGGDAQPYLSQIIISGASAPPSGFVAASGQLIPITQNQALFSLFGTTYGGNGNTTFALPNLNGRAAVDSGTGAGLSTYTAGQVAGSETNRLTAANYPAPTGSNQKYSNIQPYLALHYMIAVQGIFPIRGTGGSLDNINPFIGQIELIAGNVIPIGWAACDGQTLSIEQNTALFSILGNSYGGNGITTFDLPDLDSRVPVGVGGSAGWTLGDADGVEFLPTSASELPPTPEPICIGLLPLSAWFLRRRQRFATA